MRQWEKIQELPRKRFIKTKTSIKEESGTKGAPVDVGLPFGTRFRNKYSDKS